MLRPAKIMMNKTLELGEGLWLGISLFVHILMNLKKQCFIKYTQQ